MATVAAFLPRARPIRARPVLALLLFCLIAAAFYAWMRVPVGRAYHASFARICAGAEMQPQDLHCRITEASTVAATAEAALLVGLGLALPGAVLAASGRRLSAVVPVALAGAGSAIDAALWTGRRVAGPFGVSGELFAGDVRSYWTQHPELAVLVDVLLVAVPAIVIAFVLRPPRRPRPEPLARHGAWVATLTIGAAIVAVRLALPRVSSEPLFAEPFNDAWITTGLMALFAAMLGTDRRWWPWSLVPVAVLLSLGPAMAVLSIPSHLTALTWFGGVVPLIAVGLVASLWRPLAERLAGGRGERAVPGAARERAAQDASARIRPVVVLNALAAALLAVSAMATATDPLPIQIGTRLPTYLGERERAQDVRAKMNLGLAMDAMAAYRAEQGSYAGFDAAMGEFAVPELDWSDRPVDEELTVAVVAARKDLAQVVARSGSGEVFCLQADGPDGLLTFGSAHPSAPEARANCEAAPWTADATRFFDVGPLCAGADEGVLPLCRSVQRLLGQTLARPTAT